MEYRVSLTPQAAEDVEAIYSRIIEEAPDRGQLWFNQLIESLFSLATFPERCETVLGLSTRHRVIRKLLYGRKPHTYRIYFDIVDETVRILHVRHGARCEPDQADILA